MREKSMTDVNKRKPSYYPTSEELMQLAKELGIKSIHTKTDPVTGAQAFIVVHNTDHGPAIGGTRFQKYDHPNLALYDAILLAYKMALKNASMGLPHGGAKAVVDGAPIQGEYDRAKLFEWVGDCVEELNGDYIASLDAGTYPQDMNHMLKSTKHVIGATPGHLHSVDPSIYTAYGIFLGMKAALEHKNGHADFQNKTVAIQGAGHVASHLVDYLLKAGAYIVIADIRDHALEKLSELPNVKIVSAKDIYDVPCDIFAPCALGGVINLETIGRLQCSMIIGATNNQLADESLAQVLHEKGILYMPDFIVNAGGVISASDTYYGKDANAIKASVERIYTISKDILKRADKENILPCEVAVALAKENLKKDHG
jgi:leucine dehydrogenase